MRKLTNLIIIAVVLLTIASCTKEKTLVIGPPKVSAKEVLNDKRMKLEDITVSDSGTIVLVPVNAGPKQIFFRYQNASIGCVGCPDPGYLSRAFAPFFEFNTREVSGINPGGGIFSNSGPISVIGSTEPGSSLGIYAQFCAYTSGDIVQLVFAPKNVLVETSIQIPSDIVATEVQYGSGRVRLVNMSQLTGVYRLLDHGETVVLYGTSSSGKFITFTFRK